jgi:hypothetical protein
MARSFDAAMQTETIPFLFSSSPWILARGPSPFWVSNWPEKKVLKFLSWRVQQRLSIDINGLSGSLGKRKNKKTKIAGCVKNDLSYSLP